jgi:hypothetical protein
VDTRRYFHWLRTCKTSKGTRQASALHPTEMCLEIREIGYKWAEETVQARVAL